MAKKRPAAAMEVAIVPKDGPPTDSLDFLNDPAKHRAAYGRLDTAIKKIGDPETQAAIVRRWDAIKSMKKGKDAQQRAFLEKWTIDPSFGENLLDDVVAIEKEDAEFSDEEEVSRSRLEVLEGKEGAKCLLDNNCLEEVVEKYDRQAWKYSVAKARRGSNTKQTITQKAP